jgi:hypothetical protein
MTLKINQTIWQSDGGLFIRTRVTWKLRRCCPRTIYDEFLDSALASAAHRLVIDIQLGANSGLDLVKALSSIQAVFLGVPH